MINWFKSLRCQHEWDVAKEENFDACVIDRFSKEKTLTGTATRYTLRCKRCGDIAFREVGFP